jgi:Asp/Glu/hydantoin racemase
VLPAGAVLTAVTADPRVGPAVVRDAAGLRQAGTNALALAAAHADRHDSIVLGISLDGAVDALRAAHPSHTVVGMTEAALATAAAQHRRLGLLTIGAALLPLYRARVERLGWASRVVADEAPELPAAFRPGPGDAGAGVDPATVDALADAVRRLQARGAQAVVLAGAVLCGHDEALGAATGLPCFDGVACAVAWLQHPHATPGRSPGPGAAAA